MTNQEILDIALRQSAIDMNCGAEDFLRDENIVVVSAANPDVRRYHKPPFFCNLVSYGNNVVASVDASIADFVAEYINSRDGVGDCFTTPNIYVLNEEFQKHGQRVSWLGEFFLPDMNALRPLPGTLETRLLRQADFADLYTPEWSNALSEKRPHLDVLGVGAYDGGKLVGLAGCSADCETMRQIGIDVLPEYRRRGIASALTSRLAVEILERGKVPFYCANWSNIKSVRNAITSGFRPAWVDLSTKRIIS